MLTFCVEVFEDGLKQNQLEKEMTLQRPATDEQCLRVRQEAVEALVSAHVTRSYVRRATKDTLKYARSQFVVWTCFIYIVHHQH